MLIEVPITTNDQIRYAVNAGADILYVGIDSKILFKKSSPNNRRPWVNCNYQSTQELQKAYVLAEECGVLINLVLNEQKYSDAEKQEIFKFLAENKHVTNLTLMDISLIIDIKKLFPNIKIVGSVGLNLFNYETVKYFYENFLINDVVLPREITIDEVKEIRDKCNDGMVYHYIIKNDDCFNIDGMCSYTHGIYKYLACDDCKDFHISGAALSQEEATILDNELKQFKEKVTYRCKACAIKGLKAAGVNILKLAGRGRDFSKIVKDIYYIKDIELNTNKFIEDRDFFNYCRKRYNEIFYEECPKNCLYNKK